MRASYLTAYGGNEVVSSGELPDPVLSEGTSLIEIKAAGVNPVELAMRAGDFQRVLPYTFPQVPGFDISGVVREVSGSSRFKVGDEVYACMSNRAPGPVEASLRNRGHGPYPRQAGTRHPQAGLKSKYVEELTWPACCKASSEI